jgi:hypothetical protein
VPLLQAVEEGVKDEACEADGEAVTLAVTVPLKLPPIVAVAGALVATAEGLREWGGDTVV